jgi:5'-hydroxyaverantin dehydrogenase
MGRATAQAWAQAGAFITIADIQPLERGTAIVNELGAEVGPRCKYVYCDVIKWESQVSAVQAAFAASPLCVLDVVITFSGVCVQPGGLLDLIEAAGEATRRQAPPPPA